MGPSGASCRHGLDWKLTIVAVLLTFTTVKEAYAQPGMWEVLVSNAGISSMHTAVDHYGTVIMIDHPNTGPSNITLANGLCRNVPYERVLHPDCWAHSVLLNPWNQTVRPLTVWTDTWCSSGQFDANGTLVSTGGDFEGFKKIRYYRPCPPDQTCDWEDNWSLPLLQFGRWYSTNQILPDGRQIVVGGREAFTIEFVPKKPLETLVFLPFLTQTSTAGQYNLYPFVHLLPDGTLYIFANKNSIIYNYQTSTVMRTFDPIPGNPRNYPSAGSAVMLPLTYVDNYTAVEILVCGGANSKMDPANVDNQMACSTSCGRIKVTDPHATWVLEYMPFGRCMGDMTLLPDKNVLIINGARNGMQGWKSASNPAFSPVLYKPYNQLGYRFRTLAATTVPRMYHSTANLLTDGRVMVAGGNVWQYYTFDLPTPVKPTYFSTQLSVEAFTPPYAGGERPLIISSKAQVAYNEVFQVNFWDSRARWRNAEPSFDIVLTNAPFVTHSYAQGQRLISLPIVNYGEQNVRWSLMVNNRFVYVRAPPNSAVAPAAYYMLWVVKNGNPSKTCTWIQIHA